MGALIIAGLSLVAALLFANGWARQLRRQGERQDEDRERADEIAKAYARAADAEAGRAKAEGARADMAATVIDMAKEQIEWARKAGSDLRAAHVAIESVGESTRAALALLEAQTGIKRSNGTDGGHH